MKKTKTKLTHIGECASLEGVDFMHENGLICKCSVKWFESRI